jgi:nucleotide-binding universal stress UspA family protein
VTAVETIVLANRLARAAAEAFTLLHVYHVPFEPWVAAAEAPEYAGEAAAHVDAVARAMRPEVPVVRPRLLRGEPSLQILRAAIEERADLVAVGTRGRSALSRALAGSVAEWLVANAPCDVAVARCHRLALEGR